MSDHDDFSAALNTDAYKEWKDGADPKPAPAPTGEQQPAPAGGEGDGAQQPGAGQPRDAAGRFATNADGTPQREEPREREPFEGFSDLAPAAQAEFRRLLGERDDYRTRYTRQLGQTRQLARNSRPGTTQAAPENRPGRPAQTNQQLQDMQRTTSGMAPGAARDAVQKKLDKWEAHLKEYPDDAAAIEQRLGAMRDELATGFGPLADEMKRMRAELEDMRGFAASIESERTERFRQENQSILDEVAGDNWRQIAGWEDENGTPVPREKQAWHPEFVAWVEGHDPDYQDYLWQTLAHTSPRVTGSVIAAFNRDRFAVEGGGSADGGTTPTDPVAARRAANLRDVTPGAARSASPGKATWSQTGDDYADAVNSPAYDAWKKA